MDYPPPKYSIIELGQILEKEPILPKSIDENIFEQELKGNTNLKWRINPFLYKKEFYKLFLSKKSQRWIKILGLLNWCVLILIITISFWTEDYILLTALLIYPFFLNSGVLDHWIVIFNSSVLLILDFVFSFRNHYFVFVFMMFISAYIISRLKFEMLERSIFEKAFTDFKTFWKYYSNKLIYIDKGTINKYFEKLFEKHPELGS